MATPETTQETIQENLPIVMLHYREMIINIGNRTGIQPKQTIMHIRKVLISRIE
jgi:hypothetical protein